MATQLFLVSAKLPNWTDGVWQTAQGAANLSARTLGSLATARGSGVTSGTINTGFTAGDFFSIIGGTTPLCFLSHPVSADVTISGTITFNLWGFEQAMTTNIGLMCIIARLDHRGMWVATIVSSERGVEANTASAVNNWTATPTSTAMNKGDRLMVCAAFADIGAAAAQNNTGTFRYNGTTAAADGDSYVSLTETIAFTTTAPTGTQVFLTSVASGVDAGGDTEEFEAWTSRGATATSKPNQTPAGSVDPDSTTANNEFHSATTQDTGWLYPTGGQNMGVGGPSWSNPGNVVSDNGAYAQVTSSGFTFDTLRATGIDLSAIYGRATCILQAEGRVSSQTISHPQQMWGYPGGGGQYTMPFPSDAIFGMSDVSRVGTAKASGLRATGTAYVELDDAYANESGVTYFIDYVRQKWYFAVLTQWYTRPLQAFTLSGLVRANLRAVRSSASVTNGHIGFDVSVCNGDGSSPVVWARGYAPTAFTSTEAAYTIDAGGDDVSVANGQRLRIRVFIGVSEGGATYNPGDTASLYYDGPTANASGDSWLQFTQTIQESAGPAGGILPRPHQSRDRYAVTHR